MKRPGWTTTSNFSAAWSRLAVAPCCIYAAARATRGVLKGLRTCSGGGQGGEVLRGTRAARETAEARVRCHGTLNSSPWLSTVRRWGGTVEASSGPGSSRKARSPRGWNESAQLRRRHSDNYLCSLPPHCSSNRLLPIGCIPPCSPGRGPRSLLRSCASIGRVSKTRGRESLETFTWSDSPENGATDPRRWIGRKLES